MDGVVVLLLVILGLAVVFAPWIALAIAVEARRRAEALEHKVDALRLQIRELRAQRPAAGPMTAAPPTETIELEPAAAATPPSAAAPQRRPVAEVLSELQELVEIETEPTIDVVEVSATAESFNELHPGVMSAPPLQRSRESQPETKPERKLGWEEHLSTRLPIWIGAFALALAGIFMVRYFVKHEVLGPLARVCLAGGFGLVMIGVGELVRRRQSDIAQGLCAAGIAVLYGTLLSAVNLHGLISPMLGFVLMSLVTAAAVALSLRHGPFVALLGLAGGFIMPALLGPENVPAVQLFGFLLLLEIALTVLTRTQRWWWLMVLTLLGGFGWAALWLAFWYDPADSTLIGLFLLASIAAFVIATLQRHEETLGDMTVEQVIAYPAVVIGLLLMGWLVRAGEFTALEWAFMGLLGAGSIVLARLSPRYLPMPILASAAGVALLAIWGDAASDLSVDLPVRFNVVSLMFGVLYGLGAYAAMWGAARPDHWARLSALSALAYLLTAYWYSEGTITGLPWWVLAAVLAISYTAAASPVYARRGEWPRGDDALAALALAACAFAGLAAPMELERQWIAVAWALEVLLIAGVSTWLKLPQMRWAVWALGGLVTLRLVLNPAVLEYPIGEHVIFNWLLYGYGVPALCFAGAAWIMRRNPAAIPLSRALELATGVLVFCLVTLMIRHGFHPTGLGAASTGLYESSTYSVAWLLLALGFMMLATRFDRAWLGRAADVAIVLGLLAATLGSGLANNPLNEHTSVGSVPLFNGLLYLYGIPAVLAIVIARLRHGDEISQGISRLAGVTALVLAFGLVTLLVRQSFQGPFLDGETAGNAEWYAYSAAWIVFAAVLLAIGVMRRSHLLRWASLAVLLASVVKVFIFDTAHLNDLWRVVSLFGLGVSLFIVSLIYQRFVFGRPELPERPEEADADQIPA